jgi:hypothetical protein
MFGHEKCKGCEHGKFDAQSGDYRCGRKNPDECYDIVSNSYTLFQPRVTRTKETLADETACEVFDYLKAKIFNLLESQLENGPQLMAAKRISADYIGSATAIIKQSIINK